MTQGRSRERHNIVSPSGPTGASVLLAHISIVDTWYMLGGPRLRGGHEMYRGQAWWRGGDGFSVSVHAVRGLWFDHRDGVGGGVLDLVVRARGGDRKQAARWLAVHSSYPLDSYRLSRAERHGWARERQEFERDLPAALYWQRGMTAITEELLAELKASFFDSSAESSVTGSDLQSVTRKLTFWQGVNRDQLVAEYRAFRQHWPQLTDGMVHVARLRERAAIRVLLHYLDAHDGSRREE